MDLDVAASGLLEVTTSARAMHPAFDNLYRSRDRPQDPLLPMPNDAAALAAAIRAGRLRNDTDRRSMPGGGYHGSWDDNTRRFEQARIGIYCGATGMGPPNSVTIAAPPGVTAESTTAANVRKVLDTVIGAFRPDWALVRVGFTADHFRPWMLYLQEEPKRRVEVKGATTERLAEGVVYTTSTGWFDPANETHTFVASQLELALLRSGALFRHPSGTVSGRVR